MAQLQVLGINHPSLPYQFKRLFTRVQMHQSSSSNVYKAVRRALRNIFGNDNIEVSCMATFQNNRWIGACKIHGQPYTWEVF